MKLDICSARLQCCVSNTCCVNFQLVSLHNFLRPCIPSFSRRALLRNPEIQRDPRRHLQVVQKVIACMTLGIDVSKLFSEMIMVRDPMLINPFTTAVRSWLTVQCCMSFVTQAHTQGGFRGFNQTTLNRAYGKDRAVFLHVARVRVATTEDGWLNYIYKSST